MEHKEKEFPVKNICLFCQSTIKDKSCIIYCPKCNSPYHIECWEENGGCSLYGCDYKIRHSDFNETMTIEYMLNNIEYLINKKNYIEAINECNKILETDSGNYRAKSLYNTAISSVNIKNKLLDSAEKCFEKKDYESAEIYYNKLLQYTDEKESDLIKTKLVVIKEIIPQQIRRKKISNLVIYGLIFIMLCSLVYLLYDYFYLREEREFNGISRIGEIENNLSLERQISGYEKFLKKYPESRFSSVAVDRINYHSSIMVERIVEDDWKNALKYHNKIIEKDNPKTYRDLFEKIENQAEKKLKNDISSAKKCNREKKFTEAKKYLESAVEITSYFPGTKLYENKSNLDKKIILINKKIAFSIKQSDIENEINKKLTELKEITNIKYENYSEINAIVSGSINKSIFVCKELNSMKLIGIKLDNHNFKKGEYIMYICYRKGNISYTDELNNDLILPLYIPVSNQDIIYRYPEIASEKESIIQRLNFLNIQKQRIDSVLNSEL